MFAIAHNSGPPAALIVERASGSLFPLPLTLAGADDDEHHAGSQCGPAHPGWNRMVLRDFRLDAPDFEDAFLARIGRRLDQNKEPARNQDSAHNLQNSHIAPLWN